MTLHHVAVSRHDHHIIGAVNENYLSDRAFLSFSGVRIISTFNLENYALEATLVCGWMSGTKKEFFFTYSRENINLFSHICVI